MKRRVLIIAGSDSGGGAGIQADIKTVTALGGYATTAITALTAQNTKGVFGILEVPVDFITQQIQLVLSDIGTDVIKTGMLQNADVINAIADAINTSGTKAKLVVDPVMIAKDGSSLLAKEAISTLKEKLIARASVVTPNIPEAEVLTGMKITTPKDMLEAGKKILAMGAEAVLMKGGHLEGDEVTDILITQDDVETFHTNRIKTKNTHGTGCTLASAIACCLSRGMPLRESVMSARAYLRNAIKTASNLGEGYGPLNHYMAF